MAARRSVRAPSLSWNRREHRWRFRYRNKNYAVSPRQLECPADTKAASQQAAELWRDKQVASADSAAYSGSEGRWQLLWSKEHAIRNRDRMVRMGESHAVRQWSNILATIESAIAAQCDLPSGVTSDPEDGLERVAVADPYSEQMKAAVPLGTGEDSMRFTIRDLLWAMLVACICGAWFAHIQLKDRQYGASWKSILETIERNQRAYSELLKQYESQLP